MKEFNDNNVITGLFLADLHFGAIVGHQLYDQLLPVLNTIKQQGESLDYIMILGDYFDAKCSLTSQSAKFALLFMSELVKLSQIYKIKIRIIKGTLSHDLNQLDTAFSQYISMPNTDFKIYNTVGEEELFPNFKVLYVPEEYISSKDEYYQEYFSKPDNYYALAAVHGTFENVIPVLKSQEYEGMNPHAPIFTEKDFGCAQVVMSGHIHKRTKVANDIYYIGSYSRFCHGEELPKGCLLLSSTPSAYETVFLENINAPKYITINYGTSMNVLSAEQVIEKIKEYKKENGIDNLRVQISLEEDEKVIANMALVKSYFQKDKSVKLKFTNELRARKETEKENKIREQQEEYSYLLDKGLTIPEKVSLYLKATQDYQIESCVIDKVLNTSEIDIPITGGK